MKKSANDLTINDLDIIEDGVNINDLDVIESGVNISAEESVDHAFDKQLKVIQKGIYFPANILNDFEIPWAAKYIYSIIRNFHSSKKKFFGSNLFLAVRLGCTEQYVSNMIRLLKNHNCITIKQKTFKHIQENLPRYTTKRIILINDEHTREHGDEVKIPNKNNNLRNIYKNNYKPDKTKVRAITISNNVTRSFSSEKDNGGFSPKTRQPLSNSSSNRTLKRKQRFPKKKQTTPPKKNTIVEAWNSLPNIQHHLKPDTKVYKAGVKGINSLLNGTFLEIFHPIKPTLKAALKTNKHLTTKWTKSMVLEAMQNVSNAHSSSYWPLDTTNLARDLPTVIYNPNTHNSLLFAFYLNPPKLKTEPKTAPKGWTKWWIGQNITSDAKSNEDILNSQLWEIWKWQEMLKANIPKSHTKESWTDLVDRCVLRNYADYIYNWQDSKVKMLGVNKNHWAKDYFQYQMETDFSLYERSVSETNKQWRRKYGN